VTTAHAAQISVLVSLTLNVAGLVGANIPVYIGVAPGSASLTRTQCGAGATDSGSYMTVQPGLANICLAGHAPDMFNAPASAPLPSCTPALPILTVGSASAPIASIDGAASVQLMPASSTIAFTGVGSTISSQNPVVVTSNNLGQDLNSALGSLLTSLSSSLSITLLGGGLNLGFLIEPVVALLQPILTSTVLQALTGLLEPLLTLLGAQVGTATVTDLSLTCGNVQLVN
jgi:uncharacterized membrane protein